MKISMISELLSPITKNSSQISQRLSERYGSFVELAEADIDAIAAVTGDSSVALYIKLAVALVSRRVCDSLRFGKKHTQEEIENYLVHLFFGLTVETVYVISIDKAGKTVACDKVNEGTVNFSNVTPRKLLEVALRRGASEVIVAHNHPGGYAIASGDDISATALLNEIFASSGIKLLNHYVVAASECNCVHV